ncbi:energy-coupling factor ABC transporter ATP-binding protein [Thalassobacillus sp. CUG 92003]|uniref:energy-coupling factor ABC transporter ATP-binding protein n=1 Tax=Thalassobacillus sp. CUG 92003 TaxID=2736641 RepID=UPI0015E64C73|nr:ABC transporter ATP-binding protein [Thalassobacillus sp. CUG 92003]
MPDITVKNVQFYFPGNVEALHAVDLHLPPVPTAIVGENGAGKTTFAKLLKRLLKPSQGKILLNGGPIDRLSTTQIAAHIGLVFQNPDHQIFKNRVRDEVMFGPLQIGLSKKKAYEAASQALKRVGLAESSEENPYDLALSERKLVGVASILAMDTDVIILDEPTIGQDERGKQLITSVVRELSEEGKLVLCILHDMNLVADMCERTIVFHHGRVFLDGETNWVFSHEEVLNQAAIEPPQVMQVARQLGIKHAVTEQALLNELAKLKIKC